MSEQEELDVILERATIVYRDRAPDGALLPAPAWADLTADQRVELHERQMQASVLSAALTKEGWSATVMAVMSRM
jgi:hypothetical protein